MPKDKDNKTAAAATQDATIPATDSAPDPRDLQIKDMELALVESSEALIEVSTQVTDLQDKLAASEKANKKLEKQLADAVKALGEKGKPADNTACRGGKTLKVVRTVTAKFALDEVKKGFLDENAELLVTEPS